MSAMFTPAHGYPPSMPVLSAITRRSIVAVAIAVEPPPVSDTSVPVGGMQTREGEGRVRRSDRAQRR